MWTRDAPARIPSTCPCVAIDGTNSSATGLAEQRPDLILSDVMMPIMDGPKLLRALKASPDWRDIPVVLMSALRKLEKEEFPDAAAFLTKPFVFDRVLEVVESIIGKAR